jgi:uncharacterized YccA/Bax inhibitor family protein
LTLKTTSSNPAFARDVFAHMDWAGTRATSMTVTGTVGKTALLLAILSAVAGITWTQAANHTLNPYVLFGSAIGGMILAFVTIFKPTVAPYTSPFYAALEGAFLGAISSLIEKRYPGIAMQAVGLTFATLAMMLFLYGTRIIRVTQRLAMGIVAATGAIALLYLVSFVLMFFGVAVPFIHGSSLLGIGFSLFVVGLAAFNLLLDFDFIERGAASAAPKWMEWYGAFGLMVTLIWLYLEILRLLRKLQDRR